MIRAVVITLLLALAIVFWFAFNVRAQPYFSQNYNQRTHRYERCGVVGDRDCQILPRQGETLQPLPRDQRLTYQAAHDLAVQRGYFDPFERPGSSRPPPRQQARPRMSKEQWKQAIIEEGNKYCNTYPTDSICHFREPTPDAQPPAAPPQ